jgi:hypothetical protein
VEWTIKLEARTGWGEVETIKEGRLKRRVVRLTAQEIGLTLVEGKEFFLSFSASCSKPRWRNTRCAPVSARSA